MNSHGHVVGSYMQCFATADEAFYWTPETGRVTLPRPEGVFSAHATDINDNGLIVGGHGVSGVGWTGFVYNPNTRAFTYLQPLHPGVTATTVSSVSAINSAGIAVGSRVISKPGVTPAVSNAVIWDTNTGEVIDLGVMEGPNSWAASISVNGNVAGSMGSSVPTQGWVLIDGVISFLGPVPGGTSSGAFDVNASGAVASAGLLKPNGSGMTGQPAVWKNNHWTLLPHPLGATTAGAHFVTHFGQVGGTAAYPANPGWVQWPVLWQHGTAFDLDDLAMPNNPALTLTHIRGMNDHGQILTRAIHTGLNVAVALSPIDRPQADLNVDCVTDVHDLLILLDDWGKRDSPADLNGDGVVDVSDLLILLANWSN